MPDTPLPEPRTKQTVPTMVAHRGASARYPENTIIAYQAAIDAGAKFVELDTQITLDQVPIVHHDQDLKRMTGNAGDILTMNSADVLKHRASYPEKFGDKFRGNPLSTLSKFAQWFSQYPEVIMFVEIKSQSVEAFGESTSAKLVLDAIKPVRQHAVVISFHVGVLEAVRRADSALPIGWVLPAYDDQSQKIVQQLKPEYLFCDTKRVPPDRKVWLGDWQWALYNTDSVEEAMDFFQNGFDMLETNRIVDLLSSKEFTTL